MVELKALLKRVSLSVYLFRCHWIARERNSRRQLRVQPSSCVCVITCCALTPMRPLSTRSNPSEPSLAGQLAPLAAEQTTEQQREEKPALIAPLSSAAAAAAETRINLKCKRRSHQQSDSGALLAPELQRRLHNNNSNNKPARPHAHTIGCALISNGQARVFGLCTPNAPREQQLRAQPQPAPLGQACCNRTS